MITKSILFMVSLNKKNRASERNILIEAGLLSPHSNNLWAHYYVHPDATTAFYLANSYKLYSYWHIPLIISARDLVVLFSLKTLNPKLSSETLLQTIKLNARNKHMLKGSGITLE